MPIYEYICNACGHSFEKLVSGFSAQVHCPECSGDDVERLMSAFGMGGRSKKRAESGGSSTASSSCGSCTATSCAGCK